MDIELFEYEMKRAGYKTPNQRAKAMGLSNSAYYRRLNNSCECTEGEIRKVAEIIGWEATKSVFFS